MKDNNLEELIADYLDDRLPQGERHLMEHRISADPVFAKKVAESEKAYQFVRHLYYKDLRQKLVDQDQYLERQRIVRKKWLITGTFIMLCSFICFVWIQSYWSPSAVASRYGIGVQIHPDRFHLLPSHDQYWQAALQTYLRKDFKNAYQQFQPFTENTTDPYFHQAQWNILLCRLVLDGATREWKNELDMFIQNGPNTNKALEVKKITGSWKFKIASINLRTTFSTMNPQII